MKKGFTLAEILITLAVIGIVAAMTLPTLITNVRTKANTTKKEVFRSRLLNGLKETAVQDTLMGYDSTMEFAKVLGQHYKMFNVCDTNNIKACYNVDDVVLNSEGDTLAVADITKAKNLSLEEDDGWLDPVTMVATDGTVFIMSYNKNCAITEAELNGTPDNNGKYSRDTVVLTCIDGVIDINGVSAPNVQGKDILAFRSGALTKSAPAIAWTTVTSNGKTYKVSPQLTAADGLQHNGQPYAYGNWNEAKTACSGIGGRLPSLNELLDLYSVKGQLSLIDPTLDFWTATENDGFPNAYYVLFSDGSTVLSSEDNYIRGVLCLAD